MQSLKERATQLKKQLRIYFPIEKVMQNRFIQIVQILQMTGILFNNQLPPNIISIIDQFLYFPKDQYFIKRWMKEIMKAQHFNKNNWIFLIRDSAQIKIQMEERQVNSSFNFAQFIQKIIIDQINFSAIGQYLQKFCIQTILNNPKIVFNRYDVRYGQKYIGCSVLQLLTTYLINRTVNGTLVSKSESMQSSAFNIVKFILENQYYHQQQTKYVFNSMKQWSHSTTKTLQTIKLILKYSLNCYQYILPEGRLQNQCLYLNWWIIQTLFRVFIGLNVNYLSKQSLDISEESKNENQNVKNKAAQIIRIINQYHINIISNIQQQIQQTVLHLRNRSLLTFLLKLPNFKTILINQQFIFRIFEQRSMKYIKILWQDRQTCQKISKMKVRGNNILEHICRSHGLVHNIILLLWNSGYFQSIPSITNKKSQSIVKKIIKL